MWPPQIETAIKFTIKRRSKRSQHFLHLQQHQQHLLQHPRQQQLWHWKHLLRHIKNPQTRPRQHIGHLQQQQQETQQQSASTLLPLLRAKTYLCILRMGSSTLGWWSRWKRSKGSAWSGLGTAQNAGQVWASCNASMWFLTTNVPQLQHRNILNVLVLSKVWRFPRRHRLEIKNSAVPVVIICALDPLPWKGIWEFILVKSLTVAPIVISLALIQVIWRDIWEFILIRSCKE